VPSCSVSGTNFLPVECSSGTVVVATSEGTVSGTAVDADVDASAGVGADVPEGGSA
jgi:hypothetical protein